MQDPNPIPQSIAAIVSTLPPDLQREVADYVDYLRNKYRRTQKNGATHGDWSEEDMRAVSLEALRRAWPEEDEDLLPPALRG